MTRPMIAKQMYCGSGSEALAAKAGEANELKTIAATAAPRTTLFHVTMR